jgi:delta11-fatty-acid desaturase
VAVQVGLNWHGILESYRMPSYNKVVTFGHSKYLNPKRLVYRLVVHFLIVHVLPFIFHGATIKGVLFAVIPIHLFSLFFMISTQINHLIPDAINQLDENFFIHQVKTSHNVATDSYLLFLFTGGLNMQIEHHLFPSLNHCHLRKLTPKVQDLCKKYGVKYSESKSLWSALCKHVAHLKNYSLNE